MTDRPSDRAIAQAFHELGSPALLAWAGDYQESVLARGREIDAAAPEGAQGAVAEVTHVAADNHGHRRRIRWLTDAAIPAGAKLYTTPPQPTEAATFQAGVSDWMAQCFVPSLYSNMTERGDRLLEEVLELLQAHGYDRDRVSTLVGYVYDGPPGEPAQEVGGVMVTLAAYCWIAGLDMHAAGATELARIRTPEVMAKIRVKQEAKNALQFDTPLPGYAALAAGEPSVALSEPDCPHSAPYECCDCFTARAAGGEVSANG